MSPRVDDRAFPPQRAEELMRRALDLTNATHPHPNPRVGALILSPDGDVMAAHAHQRTGAPHAEAAVLAEVGDAAEGSTLVSTLEPCTHHGRTPPCVDAIIASGVERVIVGAVDPDPRVAGRGIETLRAAGIDVVAGVASDAVVANDPGYFHHRSTGKPLITLKCALTPDGQAAAADGSSRWITGLAAREDGHRLRSESDAILVGAGTVISDDPRLDVRLDGYDGPNPRPVVVAGRRTIPPDAFVMAGRPIIAIAGPDGPRYDGHDTLDLPGPDGVDLEQLILTLGSRDVLTALIEGGPTLAGAALRAGVVDRLILYYGPKLGVGTGLPGISGVFRTLEEALPVRFEEVTLLGDDVRVEATIERRN